MADKKTETPEVETPEVETLMTETETTEPAGAPTGTRTRRALMLKQFLPNADFINTQVVAKGKGTKVLVGRIFGVSTGYEKRQNTLPDGKVVDSIAVKGVFQSESYLTGELGEASAVFFPMAYAEKIAATFDSDDNIKVVEVDCDVGLEATGKTIPYEWVIVAYREGEEMAVMKRLKNARARPADAPKLGGPGTPVAQLTAPAS